jgi:hypothetical protein
MQVLLRAFSAQYIENYHLGLHVSAIASHSDLGYLYYRAFSARRNIHINALASSPNGKPHMKKLKKDMSPGTLFVTNEQERETCQQSILS